MHSISAVVPIHSLLLQIMAADRTPYHRWCVKCFNCRVSLNPRTLNEHNEQLFCNCCYQNIFNPQDFSMYGYNGNITEEDRLRYVVKTMFGVTL